jgi:hypothetical protein
MSDESKTPLTDAEGNIYVPFDGDSTRIHYRHPDGTGEVIIPLGLVKRIFQLEQQLAEAETAHAETIGEIFRNEVVPLKDRIAELERELAEARKDSERLEFLFRRIIPKTDKGEDAFATYHCAYSNRQAIDNAMKGQDDE